MAEKELGKSIFRFEKRSTNNTLPEAIVDALAEMIIMSKSTHVFSSSSFYAFGAQLSPDYSGYTWIRNSEDLTKVRHDLQSLLKKES